MGDVSVFHLSKHDRMRLAVRAYRSPRRVDMFLLGHSVGTNTRLAIIAAAAELGLDLGEVGRPPSTGVKLVAATPASSARDTRAGRTTRRSA
jgi:hypothetical protein